MPTFLTALALFSCLSGGAIASRVAAPPPPILPALPWPQGLQGHDDENWPVKLASANGSSTPQLEARYAALSQLRPGIRRYNMFWNTFETEPGQDHPFACAPGSVLIPPSQAARKAAGFHGFHCYSEKQLHTFDTILSLDRQAGAQTGAIIYSAPAFYRHPNCSGFIFGKDVIKGGCAPVDSAMDAYEDYVLMLMHRYGPLGLSHYVIWNEVASAGWMDMSPFIPNRAGPNGSFPLTEKQFDVWVTKYASLVQRAASARATAGQVDKAMLWTSNDRLWERPHQREGAPLHTGVKPFLDRLWPKLAAANVTFGTAVHPYDPGNPMDGDEFADGHHPKAYTFATVHHVAEYARRQLAKLKPGVDPDSAGGRPFTLLFASEQGWPFPSCCDNVKRGRNICYAHALAADTPAMVAVTHNFFQDNPAGSEQGGQDYGLIPGNVSGDLSNGPGNPTFDAYNSTSPLVWEASNDHYCCSRWSMGCRNKSIHGVFDPIALATGTLTAHGWAWDEAAGGGGSAPVSVRVSIDTEGATVTTLANVSRPDVVAAGATPNKDHGFLVTLDVRALQGDGKMHKVSVAALPATASGVPKLLMPSPQCFRGAAVVPCGGAHAHEMAA